WREDLVRDRLVAHEAVPGPPEEARRVDVLGVREGDQPGVTDQPDQAGGDQELEDREVVDLREHDLPDPGERRRAGAGRLGGGEALAHPPLASVAVDGTDPAVLRVARGVDAPERAQTRGARTPRPESRLSCACRRKKAWTPSARSDRGRWDPRQPGTAPPPRRRAAAFRRPDTDRS